MNTTDRLWANEQDGSLTCDRHAGGYLTMAMKQRPKAKSHSTPLGRWFVVTEDEKAAWLADLGQPMTCERCRYENAEVTR